MQRPVRPEQHPASPEPADLRIVSVQPDRDHAFVDVIGPVGDDGVRELRQRMAGLLVAGARFVLVDLSEAGGVDPGTREALAAAGLALGRRQGWLRVVGAPDPTDAPECEASLADVFAMYRDARQTTSEVGRWS